MPAHIRIALDIQATDDSATHRFGATSDVPPHQTLMRTLLDSFMLILDEVFDAYSSPFKDPFYRPAVQFVMGSRKGLLDHLDETVEEQPLFLPPVDPELIRLRRDLDELRAIVEDRLQEQPSIRERIDSLEAQRRMYLHPGFMTMEEEE